jgi:hypothetical protein
VLSPKNAHADEDFEIGDPSADESCYSETDECRDGVICVHTWCRSKTTGNLTRVSRVCTCNEGELEYGRFIRIWMPDGTSRHYAWGIRPDGEADGCRKIGESGGEGEGPTI